MVFASIVVPESITEMLMLEIQQLIHPIISIFSSLVFSTFYAIGGRDVDFLGISARLWKRFIAPLLLASSAVIFSILAHKIGWWLFASLIWFLPWGYGADNVLLKLARRSIQSLIFTVPMVIFGIFAGNWQIATVQCILGAFMTVILGTLNPVKASEEEFLIAFSNTFLMGMVIL